MRRHVPLALALVLTLTACSSGGTDDAASQAPEGGGGTDTAAAGGYPEYDLSSIEAEPEVEALVPEDVAADGMLTNGVSANYPPAEFFSEDGTTITGFDIQLADAAARRMGLELDNQHAEFASILPAVGSKYEVGISSFSYTPERAESVNFTVYLQAGSQWGVATGNPSGFDPENVCGTAVGVQTGTIQHDAVLVKQQECQAEGADLTVTPYSSQQDVTTNLIGAKIDAMFADSPVVADAVARTNNQVEAIGELEEASYVGAITNKDDDGALAEALRAAYQSLIEDGTYTEILDTWGVTSGHLDEALVNPDPAA